MASRRAGAVASAMQAARLKPLADSVHDSSTALNAGTVEIRL